MGKNPLDASLSPSKTVFLNINELCPMDFRSFWWMLLRSPSPWYLIELQDKLQSKYKTHIYHCADSYIKKKHSIVYSMMAILLWVQSARRSHADLQGYHLLTNNLCVTETPKNQWNHYLILYTCLIDLTRQQYAIFVSLMSRYKYGIAASRTNESHKTRK